MLILIWALSIVLVAWSSSSVAHFIVIVIYLPLGNCQISMHWSSSTFLSRTTLSTTTFHRANIHFVATHTWWQPHNVAVAISTGVTPCSVATTNYLRVLWRVLTYLRVVFFISYNFINSHTVGIATNATRWSFTAATIINWW